MMAPDYTKRYERRISELYDQRSAEPPSLRQDPLVAVCMVGNARTLPIERVYRSIKRNFLESTSKVRSKIPPPPLCTRGEYQHPPSTHTRQNTYLFAHLKLWDTNTKVQPKHGGFSSVPTTLTSLEKALQYLDPIELKIETSQPVDSPLNPSCQLTRSAAKRLKTTDFFVGKYESRFVGQMQSVHDCYQSVVSFEQRAGIRFDAVAKIRPDAVWFYPSHSAQELIGLNDLKIVTHLTDQFIFSPRKFSEGYSSFWRNYTACKGEWTGAYFPEDAYKFAFEGEGAVYWNQRRTPQVLRRGDRNQPSAAINCGRQRRVTNLTKCMLMVYGLP